MELGDGMMSKNVRLLVAAVGLAVLGIGPGVAVADLTPEIRDMVADAGPAGPVIHLRASGALETVHYSPQPGVWIVEMPEASWDDAITSFSNPELGIERAELGHVEEFGKSHSRLTVRLKQPAQLDLAVTPEGMTLRFAMLNFEPWQVPDPGITESVDRPEQQALAELPPVASRAEIEPTARDPKPAPQILSTRPRNAILRMYLMMIPRTLTRTNTMENRTRILRIC